MEHCLAAAEFPVKETSRRGLRPPTASRHPRPPSGGQLSERELEVLKLIAKGLSNSEIANALVISEATTRTHVAYIFSKLDLRDRVQAVVLAYESGLATAGMSDEAEPRPPLI